MFGYSVTYRLSNICLFLSLVVLIGLRFLLFFGDFLFLIFVFDLLSLVAHDVILSLLVLEKCKLTQTLRHMNLQVRRDIPIRYRLPHLGWLRVGP